jgi:hypothetical protein
MSTREGLVVVVPKGFDTGRIPAIVDARRDWIAKTECRLAEQHKFLAPEPLDSLPDRIALRAIGEEWAVNYRRTTATSVTVLERPGRRLLAFGRVENMEAVLDGLRRWLSRKTRQHLSPWLYRLASERNFEFASVVVRSQRTRWASCSSHGTISLNLRLMLIPEPLVRYTLLHELAHTVEMSHGRRFWSTLQTLEPAYQIRDRELREAWRLLPSWLMPMSMQSLHKS